MYQTAVLPHLSMFDRSVTQCRNPSSCKEMTRLSFTVSGHCRLLLHDYTVRCYACVWHTSCSLLHIVRANLLAMTMDVKPDGTSCVSVVLLWALLQVLT